ncbi:hypothetical protein IKE71_03215 [Candidatus Saccharibacteria bacterium]|nr:hypothetical protein [Candidatus Saccharibacteria bacterium]
MSKKLIAGAGVVASLAVALAPLATFASDATYNSDEHTDALNVTVLSTCAFGAKAATPVVGVSHNANPETSNLPLPGTDAAITGTANIATWTPHTADDNDNLGMTPDAANKTEHTTTDVANYSIYAGTADDNMGTTTLTVVCNQNNGYKIFTQAADLSEGIATIPIVAAASATASVTGYGITVANDDSIATVTPAQVTNTTKSYDNQ